MVTPNEQEALDGQWEVLSEPGDNWALISIVGSGMPVGQILRSFAERIVTEHSASPLTCGCKLVLESDDTTSIIRCEKHWLKD